MFDFETDKLQLKKSGMQALLNISETLRKWYKKVIANGKKIP